ncbi:MAG: geranylgeranylglycerol-phosphate geranylgeranyltransferase [Chitinophagales bacterium]
MITFIRNSFNLVRGFNLLITALCLYFFQYFVIKPYLADCGLYTTLDTFHFNVLVLAVICIMAGGNVVNDYFDFERDRDAGRNTLVGSWISLDQAYWLQFALFFVGVGLGFYLGYHNGNFKQGYYFLFAGVFLWLYSMLLKQFFLIGNLVIAALSAFVFVLVVLMEVQLLRQPFNAFEALIFPWIITYMKGYALFAFLVTLIREIVKDAEDREGDAAAGMRTLAVVLPVPATNAVVIVLELLCMGLIAALQIFYWKHGQKQQFWYCFFFLQVQLLLNVSGMAGANRSYLYRNQSFFLKILMLFGILTIPIFYWFTIGKL